MGRCRTRPVGGELGADGAVERRGEGGDDALGVLVGEDREAATTGRPPATSGSASASARGAVGVVGDVEEDRRLARRPARGGRGRSASPRPRRHEPGSRPPAAEVTPRPRPPPARAKLRRWKAPGARSRTSSPGSSGARISAAPRSAAVRSASASDLGADPADDQGRGVAQHGELLGGDLELGLAQPLGVVEPDRGQRR